MPTTVASPTADQAVEGAELHAARCNAARTIADAAPRAQGVALYPRCPYRLLSPTSSPDGLSAWTEFGYHGAESDRLIVQALQDFHGSQVTTPAEFFASHPPRLE